MVNEKVPVSDVEVTANVNPAVITPVSFLSLFRSVLSTLKPVSRSDSQQLLDLI
jgi:hypothetical protein